jgi:hypothetical protein
MKKIIIICAVLALSIQGFADQVILNGGTVKPTMAATVDEIRFGEEEGSPRFTPVEGGIQFDNGTFFVSGGVLIPFPTNVPGIFAVREGATHQLDADEDGLVDLANVAKAIIPTDAVDIDASNARTNTYGGLLVKLGASVQIGAACRAGVGSFAFADGSSTNLFDRSAQTNAYSVRAQSLRLEIGEHTITGFASSVTDTSNAIPTCAAVAAYVNGGTEDVKIISDVQVDELGAVVVITTNTLRFVSGLFVGTVVEN